jgi:HSP20 family molecular chaperone IbpA
MLLPSAAEPVPGSRPWVPEVRVLNRRRSVVIRLVSPCIDPRKIRIQLSGRMLTLSTSTVDLHPDHSGYRAFRRSILLPENIDGRRVSARAGDHVLTLRISKSHG